MATRTRSGSRASTGASSGGAKSTQQASKGTQQASKGTQQASKGTQRTARGGKATPAARPRDYSHAARVQRVRDMLENRPYVTVPELVAELKVSRRTVYNDLDALERADVPLYSERVDGEVRYQLPPSAKRKTVTLTLHEGQVLPLGLAQLALHFLKGTELHEQLGEIQRKLADGATPRTRQALAEVARKIAIVPHGPKLYEEKADVLDDLLTGLVYNERVEISYRSQQGGEEKTHLIEPLTLVLYREALYLVAHSLTRRARLSFAVDRISASRRRRGERFEYPEDHDPRDFFDGAFGLLGGERRRISLLFQAQQARYVRERYWHRSQAFEELPDGRVRMTLEASAEDVLWWLLGHAGTFEVEEPAELRARVRERLQRGLAANDAGPADQAGEGWTAGEGTGAAGTAAAGTSGATSRRPA